MVSTMKMVDTKKEVGLNVAAGVRVNRTGRRSYTPQYKREVVRQCTEPGVSVAAIALAHGINANLVRRWMVRQQRKLKVSVPKVPAMLPVTIQAATGVLAASDAIKPAPKRRPPVIAAIEIEIYGARIHVRGDIDGAALRTVLDTLARR
jgi:transposase